MILGAFDSVLKASNIKALIEACSPHGITNYWIDKEAIPKVFEPLLQNGGKLFDLSKMIGVELWAHNNTRPDWHYDKDEALFSQYHQMSYPLCSMVYYVNIDRLLGGELYFDNGVKIPPQNNRQIVFSKEIFHKVANFHGTRISLLLNPWDNRPEALSDIPEDLLAQLRQA